MTKPLNKPPTKPCTRCGNVEIPNKSQFLYCTACRAEVRKASRKASVDAARKVDKAYKQKPPTRAQLEESARQRADALQLAINKESRRRDDLRWKCTPDKGRVLTPAEIAAVAGSVTYIMDIPRDARVY